MFGALFSKAALPPDRIMLVHVRLRGIHEQTGIGYRELSRMLLQSLLDCKPRLLLIPAYAIYGFIHSGQFQLFETRSEVGRFSEEIRLMGFPRSPDPLYSLLQPTGLLPADLNYLRTFGPGTVFNYLLQEETLIVNVDMPGFYATPVHELELTHQVPYRFEVDYTGQMQLAEESWQQVQYRAYVRKIDRSGVHSFPPYNHARRMAYLRSCRVIHEVRESWGHLAWGHLDDFVRAIDSALDKDPLFLVDPVP